MQQMRVLKSRRWRDGDELCDGLMGLLGAIGNRGLSPVVCCFLVVCPLLFSTRVTHVSSDAISDEKKGLVYAARVKLERATMQVEERTVNLTPGMAVTVEIKTGRRRVIEYFLAPLLRYGDESLRER